MISNSQIITDSAEETQQLGYKLTKGLTKGTVIALYGDLGSGKTTFAQGLAQGLGITKRILSPTFVIIREYNIEINDKQKAIKKLYHLDLYRLQSQKDAEDLGIKQLMNCEQNIVVIEWSEKIKDLLPQKRVNITFEYVDDNKRKITIKNNE